MSTVNTDRLTVARAMWQARRPWLLAQQIAIAEVAAPTGNEASRALAMQRALALVGAEMSRIDNAGNVVLQINPRSAGAMPGAPNTRRAPSVVCLAHLDTVFAHDAPLHATVDGTCVRCPGIGDNSRGLAALVALALELQQPHVLAHLERPVVLVATVGEEGEGNLRGARAWFDSAEAENHETVAAIAIDGPGDSTIVHHAVGSARMRIRMHGVGGHSWVHADVPNPAHAVGALIASISKLATAERPRSAVTVSRMGGGESLTSVPRSAWLDIDIRAIDPVALERLRVAVVRLSHSAASEESHRSSTHALRIEIESLGERPAGALAARHPLVQLASKVTESVGRTARAGAASTDANVPMSRGIPSIAIGAGGTGGNAHTLNEWFDDADSDVGVVRLVELVTTLACARDPFRQ